MLGALRRSPYATRSPLRSSSSLLLCLRTKRQIACANSRLVPAVKSLSTRPSLWPVGRRSTQDSGRQCMARMERFHSQPAYSPQRAAQ